MGVQSRVSPDVGIPWNRKKKLMLSWFAQYDDSGYPSSLVGKDGRILILYYQVDDLRNAPKSAKCKAIIWDIPTEW
jgi:hypothetical protein